MPFRFAPALLAWFAIAAPAIAQAATASSTAPVEVMIVGSYHMDNPGLDLNNVRADDVLTPKRQAELEAVARALAAYKPTLIAVERQSAAPGYRDEVYAKFDRSQLASERDERFQIAYRLASELGLADVRGIDEQPSQGEPDYFPFERVQASVHAHGEDAALQSMLDETGRTIAAFQAHQKDWSVARLLIAANDASGLADASMYYRLLALDSGEDQPAAELFGYWFMRNAKIFAKLMDVAKPGDRVLVLFGAGHKHWLEHLVANTPGYRVVDPVPYLRRAR